METVVPVHTRRTLVLFPGTRARMLAGEACAVEVTFCSALCPSVQPGQHCWSVAGSVRAVAGAGVKRGPGQSQHPCPYCRYRTALVRSQYGLYRRCSQATCRWKRPATNDEIIRDKYGSKSVPCYLGAIPLRQRLWAGSPKTRKSRSSSSVGGQIVPEAKRRRVVSMPVAGT